MKKLLLILTILTPLILTSPTNHITIAQLIPVPAEEYEKLICEAILKLKPSDLKKITDIKEENFQKADQELSRKLQNELYNLEQGLFDCRDKALKDGYVSLQELELMSNQADAIKIKEKEFNEKLCLFNLSVSTSDECQRLSNLLGEYWENGYAAWGKRYKQKDANNLQKYFIKLEGRNIAVAQYPQFITMGIIPVLILCGFISFLFLVYHIFISPKAWRAKKSYIDCCILLCTTSTAIIYIILSVYVDL